MSASPSTAPLERTLAVLFAPENRLKAPYVRQILVQAGFTLVGETDSAGDELEEAGLDLGLGVGDSEQLGSDGLVHTAWALERVDAAAVLKEVKARAIADEFPTLRVFAAPSATAADMAIEVLFPALPALVANPSPATIALPASPPTEDKPKPFALSNLAFSAAQDATPTKPSTRQLSPSIEKALAELEQRDEHERLRKASRSSRGSTASPATLKGGSPLSAKGPSAAAPAEGERRVFTAKSPESSDAELEADESAAGTSETEEEEPLSEVVDIGADEDVALSPSASSTFSGAPPIVRAASVASATSLASSTSTFRARPAPPAAPTVQPRLTKAAALRLGISLPPSTPRRSAATSSSAASSSSTTSVPTATRRASVVPTPRSLAKPAIAPRMTKAASLRAAAEPVPPTAERKAPRAPTPSRQAASATATATKSRKSISTAERAAMDRLARRGSTAPTSAPPPAAAAAPQVRMSRAALLRQGVVPAPTTAASGRSGPAPPAASAAPPPSTRRTSSVSASVKALREPALAPRMTKAATLRAGGPCAPMASARSGTSSSGSGRPSLAAGSSSSASTSTTATAPSNVGGDAGARPSSSTSARRTSSAGPPVVAPRLNKAAELRRAKLAAEKEREVAAAVKGRKALRA